MAVDCFCLQVETLPYTLNGCLPPPPYRRYLQRYKKTGQCTVMNTTRVVTALHREVGACGVPACSAGIICWLVSSTFDSTPPTYRCNSLPCCRGTASR